MGLSCIRLPTFSFTMHREIKDELLFAMLFFGFLLFPTSFPVADSIELPSPNAGADPTESSARALPVTDVSPPSLLPGTCSPEVRSSLGFSWMLVLTPPETVLLLVSVR